MTIAILTGTTCSYNCWYAKEEVCRCSCGGKNHGVLLDPKNPIPERVIKIAGKQYRLHSMGSYAQMYQARADFLDNLGWREIDQAVRKYSDTLNHWAWPRADQWPTWIQKAVDRHYSWPELKRISPNTETYLLWIALDVPDPLWCPDTAKCPKCIEKQLRVFESVVDEPEGPEPWF